MEHPVTVESFTVPEAARALGRSELTIRKWISADMIPAPILAETTRGYRVYSVGELHAIARVLLDHEREFSYYREDHTHTITVMQQTLHGYRMLYL